MQKFTESLGYETKTPPGSTRVRKAIAALSVSAIWAVAGCSTTGNSVSAATPSYSPKPTVTTEYRYTPWPTSPIAHPRAEVFMRGIKALPDDMELLAIIDRICRLRKEDRELGRPTTPSPNTSEIASLELGYDQLYANANGLPGPNQGGERWAFREERQQCPNVTPRTPD